MSEKAFVSPELQVSSISKPLADLGRPMPSGFVKARQRFFEKHGRSFHFHIDPRSGTVSNVIGQIPVIPGNGKNNRRSYEQLSLELGRPVHATDAKVVSDVIRRFMLDNSDVSGIDSTQLGPVSARKINDHLWHVHATQQVNGITVRKSRLSATISHGNLIMFGTEGWGNVRLNTSPKLPAAEALNQGFRHAGGQLPADTIIDQAHLEVIPAVPQNLKNGNGYSGPVGEGYHHRLAWVFSFRRAPELGTWEVTVDAHTGEVLSFIDTNQYLATGITGSTYPLTNTGICPAETCCGTMQPDQPLPFVDTGLPAPDNYTSSAGLFNYDSGGMVTTLTGRYIKVSDSCGPILESAFGSEGLNLGGTNGQHDCESSGSSAGNTPAARSAYYELNRIKEMARGYLPGNSWLQSVMTANVNLGQTCNAYFDPWDGSVNFFKSGDGCRNTGEIAQVFDHEWAHGLDYYDGNGLSSPGEAFADIAAMYRLQASCMGYGFFESYDEGCGMTADGTGHNANIAQIGEKRCALNCSGVRETDWQQLTGPENTPDTPANFVCTRCGVSPYGYNGPCGRQAHCESAVDSQAAWDFAVRDLRSPPYNYDRDTAFLVATRIFFLASGNIGNWHTCSCAESTFNGCGASNAYMQWLAADDDDGDITNGTPHMTALYNAFNRHGIACETPVPVDSGCAGAPAAAPVLTVVPGNGQTVLSWPADPVAAGYNILRTEGAAGCTIGKTPIARVAGSSYTDSGLANGRQYCYSVTAAGASDACQSPASACICTTPTLGSHGALEGQISHAETGAPFSNTIVRLSGGYFEASDNNGLFRFSALPAGTYELSVSALGRRTQSIAGIEILDGVTAVRNLALEPLPTVTVSGRVNDGSGHNWPLYATVTAIAPGYAGSGQPGVLQTVYTDPLTGQYSITLYQDTPYTITAGSMGYLSETVDFESSAAATGRDFVLNMDSSVCAPGYGVLYSESFESDNGRYRPGFYMESGGVVDFNFNWEWGKPESGPDIAHSGRNVWATKLKGPHELGDFYLTSPDIDLSQNAGKPSILSWWHWLDGRYWGTRASIDISNNGGASWTRYADGVYPRVISPWTKQSLLLSTSYSVSNFRFRFHFDSVAQPLADPNIYDGWYLDDIAITPYGGCSFTPGSLLTGHVTDAVTGLPVNGAKVGNGTGNTAISTATVNDPGLADGYFSLFLPEGSHTITAGRAGYQPRTIPGVSVANGTVQALNIALVPLPPLTMDTATLPYVVAGTDYSVHLSASGGLPPYSWSMPAGSLPEGIRFDSFEASLSGTTTMTGQFTLRIVLTDANGETIFRDFTLPVYEPLVITTGDTFFTPGSSFSLTLEAQGGTPPYSWAVAAGTLPSGMALDESTGIVSGTAPAAAGPTATLLVTDAHGLTATAEIRFIPSLFVVSHQPAADEVAPASTVVQAVFSTALDGATVTPENFLVSRDGSVQAIAAGDYHSLALKGDGTVVAWGNNDYGQLDVPPSLTGVAGIAAGAAHSLALKSDGTVTAWGKNDSGQTDVPSGLTGVVAVAAGSEHSLALKDDGTVVAWGMNDFGQLQVPGNLDDVTAVGAGRAHSVALKGDGTVVAWGYNGSGESTVPTGLAGVVAIAVGEWHTLALKDDNTVVAWGYNNNGQTSVPAGLSGVTAIAAGDWHSLAFRSDGTLVGWGLNDFGQITAPAGLSDVSALAAGAYHSVALLESGMVSVWGDSGSGQTALPGELGAGGNGVSGALDYDPATFTVRFTPDAPLTAASFYNVFISGIISEEGIPLTDPVSWRFSTHDLLISTVGLPPATVNTPYSEALAATGGTPPYAWSITGGSLPAGLDFDPGAALISGTPTTIGPGSVTFTVTDSNGDSFNRTFSLPVYSAVLAVATQTLPDGYVSSPYSDLLAATGGTPPYRWNISSGTLPAGLALSGATGAISGTPTSAVTRTVTFRVRDALNASATKALSIRTYNLPAVTTSGLPFGTTGTAYSQTLTTTGGKAPLTWKVTGGSLPSGLVLGAASGTLAGTPVTEGDYTFSVRVTDAHGQTGEQTLGLSVYQPLLIGTANLPYSIRGTEYGQTLTAEGGAPPYAWSLAGTLPAGFSLQGDSGVLSGAATSDGSYPLTIFVTDANGTKAQQDLVLHVAPQLVLTGHSPPDRSLAPVSTVVEARFNDLLEQALVNPDTVYLVRGGAAKAISAGGSHAVALKSNGTVAAWGFNDYGQSSVPGGLSQVVAIAAGVTHTLALRSDGTLVAWGDSVWERTALPEGLSGVKAITAGEYNSVALKQDGTVLVWGFNSHGQNNVPADLGTVTAVDAGGGHIVALRENGTVAAWGNNENGQADVPQGLSDVAAVSAGGFHTVALKSDGSVAAWGWNDFGQTDVPPELSGVAAVSAGYLHTVALKRDGTVVAWGENEYGQASVPAGLSGVVAVSAGNTHTMALLADGTVVSWGSNLEGQARVPHELTSAGNRVSGALAYDSAAQKIRFTPAAFLDDSTTYYASINGIASRPAGVPLTMPFTWSFSTYRPAISTTALPFGTTGVPYSRQLDIVRAVLPCAWSVVSGSMPDGLVLDSATGLISGTPLTAGYFVFTIQAVDANSATAVRELTIDVYAPLAVSTAELTAVHADMAYSRTLTAQGGRPGFTWNIIDGTLPPGLVLSSATGVVAGTTTTTGSYTVTVQVTDANGSTASRQYTVTVAYLPVRIPGTQSRYFTLPQSAYADFTAPFEGGGVDMVEGTLTADLICDREITITVQGGYAADYTAVVSATRLRGNMVISKGKAAVRNLVLSPR